MEPPHHTQRTHPMRYVRPLLIAFLWTLPCLFAFTQQPAPPLTAAAIMALVAAHQDATEAERAHYTYIQHVRVASHKGKAIMCAEVTDSRVTPFGKSSHQELLTLDGRLFHKGKYVTYTDLPKTPNGSNHRNSDLELNLGDDDSDRDLVESMRNNFTNDNSTESRNGIADNLFPLTTRQQLHEDFVLLGRERMNGRDVFHISFHPKDKSDFGWKGDAYIDTTAFQPVLVRTAMARNIPFAVRALLGTNVPGLGFTVIHAPQPDGTWFPISFGTEFKIKVLFVYSREITIAAENRNFEKTHVNSQIVEGPTLPSPQP